MKLKTFLELMQQLLKYLHFLLLQDRNHVQLDVNYVWDVDSSAVQSKMQYVQISNIIATSIKTSNFRLIHSHGKRLYVHMFDIIDTLL